jgi:hypothetical protein
MLIEGKSPYSDEAAEAIQSLAYGRPAGPGEFEFRADFPLYATFFFLPLGLIRDFTLARACWMTMLELGVILLAWLTLVLIRWRVSRRSLLWFFFFSLGWYYGLRPILGGNLAIMIGVTMNGALLALRSGREELTGILLALSTIKPLLVLLPLTFILFWTLAQGKWRVMLWFAITVGLLSVVSALFIPDWPIQNLREILLFHGQGQLNTLGSIMAGWFPAAGNRLGLVVSGFLGLVLILEWLFALKREFRWFLWTVGLTLTASQWIGIRTEPGNFIILTAPLFLVFSAWDERWGRTGRILIGICMLLFLVGPLLVYWDAYVSSPQSLQPPVLFIVLPLFLLIGLYWTRWWAIYSPRTLIQDLHAFEDQT